MKTLFKFVCFVMTIIALSPILNIIVAFAIAIGDSNVMQWKSLYSYFLGTSMHDDVVIMTTIFLTWLVPPMWRFYGRVIFRIGDAICYIGEYLQYNPVKEKPAPAMMMEYLREFNQ